jgi:hypothetical protein
MNIEKRSALLGLPKVKERLTLTTKPTRCTNSQIYFWKVIRIIGKLG